MPDQLVYDAVGFIMSNKGRLLNHEVSMEELKDIFVQNKLEQGSKVSKEVLEKSFWEGAAIV